MSVFFPRKAGHSSSTLLALNPKTVSSRPKDRAHLQIRKKQLLRIQTPSLHRFRPHQARPPPLFAHQQRISVRQVRRNFPIIRQRNIRPPLPQLHTIPVVLEPMRNQSAPSTFPARHGSKQHGVTSAKAILQTRFSGRNCKVCGKFQISSATNSNAINLSLHARTQHPQASLYPFC